MHDQLTDRLKELRQEYDTGEKRLQALEGEALRLRETLLRISGAIQVLQEVLEASGTASSVAPNGADGDARNHPTPAVS